MKYRCVSYPDFEPDHTWLRQVLLFVDEVHRIVPTHETLDDSDDLKRLMENCEGAVQRCAPEPYVDISTELAMLFGKVLDQPKFSKVASAGKIKITISSGVTEVEGWEFLHVKKIGSGVHGELEKRDMLRSFTDDSRWLSVPRGVGNLVLSMLADQIAQAKGYDAVTDQPLAFALNGAYGCATKGQHHLEGVVASAVASIHVPQAIGRLSAKEYAELRARHTDARQEFARMARELKDDARLDRISEPEAFKDRLDEITEAVGKEIGKYRKTKDATKFNDWVPFIMTRLFPVAVGFAFGPASAPVTKGFSLVVDAAAKLRKKPTLFDYPKVLQTLCAAQDLAWRKEINKLI